MQDKLFYKEGEKDMLILRHRFQVKNKDKSKDLITSTLIDFGIPGGDTSMARTVSLPMAIATRLIAEDKIRLKGVQTPVHREIYEPVLRELETTEHQNGGKENSPEMTGHWTRKPSARAENKRPLFS